MAANDFGMETLDIYIEQIKRVPYVKGVCVESRVPPEDAVLRIRTTAGDFTLALEVKRSYLDRTITNSLLALAARPSRLPVIVFARYISRPSGERLATAGVNFVDRVGNVHLHLGDNQTLLLGKPESRPPSEGRRTGPAAVQVYGTFLALPEAIQWTTRRVAEISGAGKTAVAEARQRLISDGILQPMKSGGYATADRKTLEEYFIRGYEQILRPHLSLGRYRSAEREPDAFVERTADVAAKHSVKWALTGAAGAYELERFYRGEETQLFLDVSAIKEEFRRELKLLPDRRGPVTLFKFFGDVVLYPGARPKPVAQPWLLFAELLYQGEPRALEAAEEIREKFLR
jgi:hypothetical protein